jgi:hypothetical protein
LPGRFAQALTGRLGSASISVTAAPRRASWVASTTELVDLPQPPLLLAIQIVGIS